MKIAWAHTTKQFGKQIGISKVYDKDGNLTEVFRAI